MIGLQPLPLPFFRGPQRLAPGDVSVFVPGSRRLRASDDRKTLECAPDVVLTVPPGLPRGFQCRLIPSTSTLILGADNVSLNGFFGGSLEVKSTVAAVVDVIARPSEKNSYVVSDATGPDFHAYFRSGVFPTGITHSRASLATMDDQSGNVVYGPHNLLMWSEDFTNAAWAKSGTCTVTANQIIAPDGTLTGDLISGVGIGGNDLFNGGYSSIAIPVGLPYSPSIQISRVSTTGVLSFYNPSGAVGGNWSVDMALLGDGWQQLTPDHPAVTVLVPFAGNALGNGIYFKSDSGGPLSFHLWGARANIGATLMPYYPTGASAYYGPRMAWDATLGRWYYLHEPQATNLLRQSENFDAAAWDRANTINGTPIAGPSLSGFLKRLEVTATTNITLNQSSVVNGTAAVFSLLVKKGSGAISANKFGIYNGTTSQALLFITLNFDTSAVTYTTGVSGATAKNLGNGVIELSLAVAAGVTSGDSLSCYVGYTGGPHTAGDFLYASDPQLEIGTVASSYIPTGASQAVRAADIAYIPVATELPGLSATAMTVYCEAQEIRREVGGRIIGSTTAEAALSANTTTQLENWDGTATLYVSGSDYSTSPQKMAASYGVGARHLALAGVVASAASNAAATPTSLYVGSYNGVGYFFCGKYYDLRVFLHGKTAEATRLLTV